MGPLKRTKAQDGISAGLVWIYFALSFTRPQDWVSSLSQVPMAKIAGVLAVLAFLLSFEQIRWPMPRNTFWLLLLMGQFLLTVPMSPVWPGGAFQKALDFGKIVALFMVIVSFVTTLKRMQQLIIIQCSSAAIFSAASLWNARLHTGRLESAFGNGYSSNPNDLALGLVTILPLSLALVFLSRGWPGKLVWTLATLLMMYAVFLTGSRGGFFSLIVAGGVLLWEFAIQGRRGYLLLVAGLAALLLWQSASGTLSARLRGTFDPSQESDSSYSSAQQREQLFWRSIEVTEEYPLFGVGPGNFQVLSGNWHVTHNAFTQMSSEGGLPALFLYLLFVESGFRNTRLTKWLSRGNRAPSLIARALRASLMGYLVGACFASVAYEYPYVLVAYTTALVWIVKKSDFGSREPAEISGVPEDLSIQPS
jgi:O-antigen ligase